MKLAILDDYQDVALALADWSKVAARADITVFRDTIADQDALSARLAPFDILCLMRERTPVNAALLARLPNLKCIVTTGYRNLSLDSEAAKARGIVVCNT